MEILWICMTAMCLIIGVIRNIKYGFDEAQAMYIFSAVALLMYLWRRHLRIKEENDDKNSKKMQ